MKKYIDYQNILIMVRMLFVIECSFSSNVLCHLVQPWFNTGRMVCTDSFYASVSTSTELLNNGLKFIGVVKTASRMICAERKVRKEVFVSICDSSTNRGCLKEHIRDPHTANKLSCGLEVVIS